MHKTSKTTFLSLITLSFMFISCSNPSSTNGNLDYGDEYNYIDDKFISNVDNFYDDDDDFFDIQSAEECYPFEEYDKEEQACFLKCDTEKQCQELEAKIDTLIDEIENDFISNDRDFIENDEAMLKKIPKGSFTTSNEYGVNNTNSGISEIVDEKDIPTFQYNIDNKNLGNVLNNLDKYDLNNLGVPSIFNEKKSHQQVWESYSNASTEPLLNHISLYKVYYENDDTVAFVSPVYPPAKENTWLLGVNIRKMVDPENFNQLKLTTLKHTMLHEFGHILSLNRSQLSTDVGYTCPENNNFQCTIDNSYLNKFVKSFWPQSVIDSASKRPELSQMQEFFNQGDNKDKYVSYYATSKPTDDFAETFTAFVIFDKPTGNTIRDLKIKSFYSSDDLVKARKMIRQRMVLSESDFEK